MNPLDLTPFEQRLLAISLADPAAKTRRRIVSVVVSALLFGAVLSYASFVLSRPAVLVVALAYIVITTMEKVLHGFGVLGYKGIIRKLYAHLQADDAETS